MNEKIEQEVILEEPVDCIVEGCGKRADKIMKLVNGMDLPLCKEHCDKALKLYKDQLKGN